MNSEKCDECGGQENYEIKFFNQPSFLFIQSYQNNIFINDIPEVITIDNNQYRFVCSTLKKPGHIVGIFKIKEKLWVIDDIYQSIKELSQDNLEKNQNKQNYYFKKIPTNVSLYFLI